MNKRKTLWSGLIVALCCVGAVADEVAQPWGAIHGDIGGRSRADDASMVLSSTWANGATVAWTVDPTAAGITEPFYPSSSFVFDEDGNLYWKGVATGAGNDARVYSVAPDGTVRWSANDGLGSPHYVGRSSYESVVVGDGGQSGRVYALGDDGADGFAVAYNKSDGSVAWLTQLPLSRFAVTSSDDAARRLAPVLYNGKLYVLGSYAFDPGNQFVPLFQIDSTTGILDWSANLPAVFSGIRVKSRGQMTFVPDAFGAGLHGLYYNADSNSGTDNVAEMFGIMVNPGGSTASLAWSSDGGKVTRSHVIHIPAADANPDDRVCTHTWADFGGEMYCWNLDGTNLQVANNAANTGHGYYDIGSLAFNGHDIIAGGFEGQIVRYMNIDVNTNSEPAGTDVYYQMPDRWWGEPRVVGGLYKDESGNEIFLSATNSRGDCINRPPGSGLGECLGENGYESRVFAVDLTNGNFLPNCEAIDDGAIFIDNMTITAGIDEFSQSTVFDSAGFEFYGTGNLPTDGTNPGGTTPAGFSWEVDAYTNSNGPPQVVNIADITTTGTGSKAIKLDAFEGCYTDVAGVFANLSSPLGVASNDFVVVVSWDQYREDVWDNVYMAEHPNGDSWSALQWDIQEEISCRQTDAFAGPVLAQNWQHIEYKFDYLFSEVTVTIDDVSTTSFLDPFGDPGTGLLPETEIRGVAIGIEGGEYSQGETAVTPPLFSFNTGSIQDHARTVYGGPLLGPTTVANPEQHIYYYRPGNSLYGISPQLVALRAISQPQDCNNNGVNDATDIVAGTSQDCNANNIPDECDIIFGTSQDLFTEGGTPVSNGIPDDCEDLAGPAITDAVSWKVHGIAAGDSVTIEMDQQINNDPGTDPAFDAIYLVGGGTAITFETDGSDGWARVHADGQGWYYGPEIDFGLAGIDPISIAGGGTIQFDARYFQDPTTNTDPYGDAPIFVRAYTDDEEGNLLGYRDFSIAYQTTSTWPCGPAPQYPTWTTVSVDVLSFDADCNGSSDIADSGAFDPTRVTRLRFYGTDWAGNGDDYVDIRNLSINTNPFDNRLSIDMVTTNGGTVESRQSGPTEVRVQFDEDLFAVGGLSNDDVALSSGTVTNLTIDAKMLIVELTGVADNQMLAMSFNGITDDVGNVVTDILQFGVLLGDAQGDMDVDLGDWQLFQDCFTGAGGGPIAQDCARADFINDGDVDASDHSAYVGNITGP